MSLSTFYFLKSSSSSSPSFWRSHNHCTDCYATCMWYLCVSIPPTVRYSYRMGSLTCGTILVHAMHTKSKQALTILHMCPTDAEIKAPPGGSPGLSKVPCTCTCSRSEYSFECCACLHDVYTYLVSAFQTHSTSFSPNFAKSSTVECFTRTVNHNFSCGGNAYYGFALI